MGVFATQFELNEVLTHVIINQLEENTFGCIIYLSDISRVADLPLANLNYDVVVKRKAPGEWEKVGEPKIDLNEEEILSLGHAIEGDKTVELYGPENY